MCVLSASGLEATTGVSVLPLAPIENESFNSMDTQGQEHSMHKCSKLSVEGGGQRNCRKSNS